MTTHHFENLNTSQHNHIDLTLDDDDPSLADDLNPFQRVAKRARTESSFLESRPSNTQSFSQTHPMSSFSPYNPIPAQGVSFLNSRLTPAPATYPSDTPPSGLYRPAFVPPVYLHPRPSEPPLSRNSSFSAASSSQSSSSGSTSHIIDLTGSPSPPPSTNTPPTTTLPPDLSPKTPVCIGQLTVTALVLYPVQYLLPRNLNGEAEWAPVRLQHEHNPLKHDSETIHIQVPHTRTPLGEVVAGEAFGVVEQKVATSLGPMLGKGLIRLDAKVRKGPPNVLFSLSGLLLWKAFMSLIRSILFFPFKCSFTLPKGIYPSWVTTSTSAAFF
jgi:SWI/SNF-related matrix-associated actin-dependent regulator of chromatin subfamily A3